MYASNAIAVSTTAALPLLETPNFSIVVPYYEQEHNHNHAATNTHA
jgi:hypothetical protein